MAHIHELIDFTVAIFVVHEHKVLIIHHRKLDRWLPLGGHIELDEDPEQAALREAREESGLSSIRAVGDGIFDVDIHAIPARGAEPEHFHYDVRYLLEADRGEELRMSSESKDLQWVAMERVEELTGEESVLRMVRKMDGVMRRN